MINENSLDNFTYRQLNMQYSIDTYINGIGNADFFKKKSLVAIDFFEENSDIFFNDIRICSLDENEHIANIKAYRKTNKSYLLENDVEQIIFVAISKNIDKINLEYIEDIQEINYIEDKRENTYIYSFVAIVIMVKLLEIKNKRLVKRIHILDIISTVLIILAVIMFLDFLANY